MNEGLSGGIATLMRMTAGFIDALQFFINFIPVVGLLLNPLISVVALFLFWLWFSAHNIKIFQGKMMKATLAASILEFMPFVGSFSPGFYFLVNNAIRITRQSEDTV